MTSLGRNEQNTFDAAHPHLEASGQLCLAADTAPLEVINRPDALPAQLAGQRGAVVVGAGEMLGGWLGWG